MDQLIKSHHDKEVVDSALVPKIRIDPASNIVYTKVGDTVK